MSWGRKRRIANEVQVGQLIVRGNSIIEPISGCRVGRAFPTELHAATAAKELDAIADWFGVVKVRATGGNPNCRAEIERIINEHGGHLGDGATELTEARCAEVVAKHEEQYQ